MIAIGVAVVVALIGALAFLIWAFRTTDLETDGVGYFGRTLDERRELRERIRRRAVWVNPLLRIIAAVYRPKSLPVTELDGVTAPKQTCNPKRFAATPKFVADERDVFVATQMKCGTTWMQQVVYEVLSKGNGNFGDDGHRHLYATSPWIESRHSVSMEDAPRIGEKGMRIIKTHMPVQLCPYSEKARYVYVTRHPVACFASILDFMRMLTGPLCPEVPDLMDWYCSDKMFWRSWPEHVEGWWRWAQERPNVLFLHYEDMLDDLSGAVREVAAFLDVELADDELARVVHKSSFDYMKRNEEFFEIAPPGLMTVPHSTFFKSGKKSRDRDVGDTDRERILAFCRERLKGASYPAARFYPELANTA